MCGTRILRGESTYDYRSRFMFSAIHEKLINSGIPQQTPLTFTLCFLMG